MVIVPHESAPWAISSSTRGLLTRFSNSAYARPTADTGVGRYTFMADTGSADISRSPLYGAHDERVVLAAEAEAVRKGRDHFCLAGVVGHVVQVAIRIGVLVV